jgi:hypothetical protein
MVPLGQWLRAFPRYGEEGPIPPYGSPELLARSIWPGVAMVTALGALWVALVVLCINLWGA